METLQSQFKNLDGHIRAKRQNRAQEDLNRNLSHGLKNEFLDDDSVVTKMFSDDALQRYLGSFGELNKDEKENKKKFFLQTKRKLLSDIDKFPAKERNSDGAQDYIRGFLASKNIYSKIREAMEINNSEKKNMHTLENPKMKVEKQHLESLTDDEKEQFDEEFKNKQVWKRFENQRNKSRGSGVPESWTDDEKEQFDEEFKNKQVWKRFENQRNKKQSSEQSDGPKNETSREASAGDNEGKVDGTKDLETVDNNSESARQENVSESDGDVIDMEQGADGKWRAEGGADTKKEQLKNALDDARRVYSRLHYKNDGMMKKIKAVFGNMDTQGDNDLANAKEAYKEALADYRSGLMENFDHLSEDQQKELLLDVKKLDLSEGVNLYEDRVAAKAESLGGKVGEYALKAVNTYKKIPTKYKIAFSGALLGGSLLFSGGVVAAGVFGTASIGKRILAAGATGVTFSSYLESRAEDKQQTASQNEMSSFAELLADQNFDIEDFRNSLSAFDNATFEKIEGVFSDKVSGRRKRVVAGIGAAAGILALGEVGKAFAAGEAATANSDDLVIESSIDNANATIEAASSDMSEQAPGLVTQAQEDGIVNSELLEKRAHEAFNTDQATIAEVTESLSDSVDLTKEGVNLLELIQNAKDVSGDMTLDQLSATDNMDIRQMMAGVVMRASQQFGEEGNIGDKETIGVYLQRLNALSDASKEATTGSSSGASVDLGATEAQEILQEYGGKSMADIRDEQARMVAEQQSVDSQFADNPEQVGWDVNDGPDSGDGTVVDSRTAEAQMDASQAVDNPEKVGWDSTGNGIEIEDGVGTLTIEKGDSIEGVLIAFFKANSHKLTEGGMGWDPSRFKDVNEWAGKRAHGLVEEYMEKNPGFDVDIVQPGTTFEIDLNNTADIRINNIDFEGGPRIVPENEKVVFPDVSETSEGASETKAGVTESLRTQEEVIRAFDLTQADYDQIRNESAMDYVRKANNVIPDQRMPIDDYLIDLSEKETVDLTGKTVGEILENTQINILDQEVASEVAATMDTSQEASSATWTDPDTQKEFAVETETSLDDLSEREYVQEMSKNPEFKRAIASQIQEASGASSINEALRSVAGRRIDFFLGDKEIGVENQGLKDLRDRAVAAFGDEGKPRPNALTGNYVTRIFAKALREGRLKEVFPSSDFTV